MVAFDQQTYLYGKKILFDMTSRPPSVQSIFWSIINMETFKHSHVGHYWVFLNGELIVVFLLKAWIYELGTLHRDKHHRRIRSFLKGTQRRITWEVRGKNWFRERLEELREREGTFSTDGWLSTFWMDPIHWDADYGFETNVRKYPYWLFRISTCGSAHPQSR